MTAPDTTAIRAQMEALTGFTAGPWRDEDGVIQSQTTVWQNGVKQVGWDYATIRAEVSDDWDQAANARLIAAAPDMRETILALCEEVDRLNAAIVRQAGAAKTLRESTLAEVQYLKDLDRSEYHAAASLDSERNANNILTDENERLRGMLRDGCDLMAIEVEAMKSGISINGEMRPGPEDQTTVDAINELEEWIDRAGRAALAQKGGE